VRRTAIRLLALFATLLVVGGVVVAVTWPSICFLLVSRQDRPLVDQTYRRVAASWRMPQAELQVRRYPVVTHPPGQVCVELRGGDAWSPRYHACYRRADGKLIEEDKGENTLIF